MTPNSSKHKEMMRRMHTIRFGMYIYKWGKSRRAFLTFHFSISVFKLTCFSVLVCIFWKTNKQKKAPTKQNCLHPLGQIPTFLALSYFGMCLLRNKRSVLRDDHRRSPRRNRKEESEPIFSTVAAARGTHYDSLWAEMCWMMSESDIRASVRCHGDARPNVTEPGEQ